MVSKKPPPSRTRRSAADFVPETNSLKRLRDAAAGCRGCDLYKGATQTVFGEGKARARLMFVGEQPGDSEDIAGHPFVGPAGKLLRKALDEAGIDADEIYVTNAVKHFKYVWRGKRRIHAKPKRIEVRACAPWLEEEIRVVKLQLIVTLGATAAQALLGSTFRPTQARGEFVRSDFGPPVLATVHPSTILRAPDNKSRRSDYKLFVGDLRIAAGRPKRSWLPPGRRLGIRPPRNVNAPFERVVRSADTER